MVGNNKFSGNGGGGSVGFGSSKLKGKGLGATVVGGGKIWLIIFIGNGAIVVATVVGGAKRLKGKPSVVGTAVVTTAVPASVAASGEVGKTDEGQGHEIGFTGGVVAGVNKLNGNGAAVGDGQGHIP